MQAPGPVQAVQLSSHPQLPALQYVPDGQTCPQEPQLLSSLRGLTEQPPVFVPLQSRNGAVHISAQFEPEHTAVALAYGPHVDPHTPPEHTCCGPQA